MSPCSNRILKSDTLPTVSINIVFDLNAGNKAEPRKAGAEGRACGGQNWLLRTPFALLPPTASSTHLAFHSPASQTRAQKRACTATCPLLLHVKLGCVSPSQQH